MTWWMGGPPPCTLVGLGGAGGGARAGGGENDLTTKLPTSPHPPDERLHFIRWMQEVALTKRVRVSVLSGERLRAAANRSPAARGSEHRPPSRSLPACLPQGTRTLAAWGGSTRAPSAAPSPRTHSTCRRRASAAAAALGCCTARLLLTMHDPHPHTLPPHAQIISSAIMNAPPPHGVVWMLMRTNRAHNVDSRTREKLVSGVGAWGRGAGDWGSAAAASAPCAPATTPPPLLRPTPPPRRCAPSTRATREPTS